MHELFKWLYNRFSQVESVYQFSIFYLDFEFKILLVGEIYWKDKSYIYINSLLTRKTMVGTPCNNFYMDSIVQMCNKQRVRNEVWN